MTLYFDVSDALACSGLKGKVTIEWGPEVYFYQRREFAFRDPDGHLIIISEETDDPVTCVEERRSRAARPIPRSRRHEGTKTNSLCLRAFVPLCSSRGP